MWNLGLTHWPQKWKNKQKVNFESKFPPASEFTTNHSITLMFTSGAWIKLELIYRPNYSRQSKQPPIPLAHKVCLCGVGFCWKIPYNGVQEMIYKRRWRLQPWETHKCHSDSFGIVVVVTSKNFIFTSCYNCDESNFCTNIEFPALSVVIPCKI